MGHMQIVDLCTSSSSLPANMTSASYACVIALTLGSSHKLHRFRNLWTMIDTIAWQLMPQPSRSASCSDESNTQNWYWLGSSPASGTNAKKDRSERRACTNAAQITSNHAKPSLSLSLSTNDLFRSHGSVGAGTATNLKSRQPTPTIKNGSKLEYNTGTNACVSALCALCALQGQECRQGRDACNNWNGLGTVCEICLDNWNGLMALPHLERMHVMQLQ
jgi:hypothetical protein